MSSKPTVSIIIPTYNEQAAIAGLLTHLQGAGADDIIVVDGCSTDRTFELASAMPECVYWGPMPAELVRDPGTICGRSFATSSRPVLSGGALRIWISKDSAKEILFTTQATGRIETVRDKTEERFGGTVFG